MTNADMIRRMSDETLAELFTGIDCPYDKLDAGRPDDCDTTECGDCIERWARQEADPTARWRAGWFE